MLVSRNELVEKIRETRKFFTVQFKTRSNHQKRTMNCLNGVKRHLTGGDRSYDPAEHDLLCTYSIDKRGYRSVPIEGILEAKIEGQHYVICDE